MFTGDETGKRVIKGLYTLGLSNKEEGVNRKDGLEIKEVYLTNAVKCAPPGNKPTKEGVNNCLPFLKMEIKSLKRLKVIIVLGEVAFNSVLSIYGMKAKLYHGVIVKLPDNKVLIGSYHRSPDGDSLLNHRSSGSQRRHSSPLTAASPSLSPESS